MKIFLPFVLASFWIAIPSAVAAPKVVGGKIIFSGNSQSANAPLGYQLFCLDPSAERECSVQWGQYKADESGSLQAPTKKNLAQVAAVKRMVDRRYSPRQDSGDDWNVLGEGGIEAGDCEDFALTNRHYLLKAGWPSKALLLATGSTFKQKRRHAILVVRTSEGDWVVDSLLPNLIKLGNYKFYWEKIQSPEGPLKFLSF